MISFHKTLPLISFLTSSISHSFLVPQLIVETDTVELSVRSKNNDFKSLKDSNPNVTDTITNSVFIFLLI